MAVTSEPVIDSDPLPPGWYCPGCISELRLDVDMPIRMNEAPPAPHPPERRQMSTGNDSEAVCRRLAVALARALPTQPFELAGQMVIRVPVKWVVERWLGWDPDGYGAAAQRRLRKAAERLQWMAVSESATSILFPCRLDSCTGWEAEGEVAFKVVRGSPHFRPGIREDELALVK